MEIRIGNVLFNKKTKRTVLLKETEVQICMYGKVINFWKSLKASISKLYYLQVSYQFKSIYLYFLKLNTDRLRSSPAALQISAHGKPQSFPPIAGVKVCHDIELHELIKVR